MELNNPNGRATKKQLWLLHILTKEDTREWQLTIKEASDKISELKGNGKRPQGDTARADYRVSGIRPLVNPHATALQQDKELRTQQSWDKKHSAIDYLAILKSADQAAREAYNDYRDQNYKEPRFAVVQHSNPLDDNSPIEKAWPMTDLCGVVWLDMKLKGNEKFINWFKKQGKTDNTYNRKHWQIDGFSLAYSPHCSVWAYPWTLDLPGIGCGNGAVSAAEASARAAVEVLDKHGIDIHMQSRLD